MADDTAGGGTGLDVEALYRREHDRIHAMCAAILRDHAEAEDAVQETFARIAAHRDRLESDAVGYLIVVARNVCRDELRRRSRRSRATGAQPSEPTPEDTVVQRGLLGFVWRRLARVEQALLADVFSGLSLAEIAQRSGTSSDVAAQRVSRLRRRIRHMVAAPAALLWPVLQGSAMGRLLAHRTGLSSRLTPLLERLREAEHALGPVLVGIAAGGVVLPQAAGALTAGAGGAAGRSHVAAAPSAVAAAGPLANVLAARGGLHTDHVAVPRASAPPAPKLPPLTSAAVVPSFQQFTASPQYGGGDDRTIFAVAADGGCDQPTCAALWRSDDGGRTWKPLALHGIDITYTVLLPPSWPLDRTVFATNNTTVIRSDDGGMTFRPVYAAAYPFESGVDPTSPPGETRIVVTSSSGVLYYDARDGLVHPLHGLPPDTISTALMTGPGADALYFRVWEPPLGQSSIYSCAIDTSSCTRAGADAGGAVVLSPTFAADHTYFSWRDNALLIRTIGSDQAVSVPLGDEYVQVHDVLPAIDYDRSGVVDVLVQRGDSTLGSVRVVRSAAQPWALVIAPDAREATITRLPDGKLLISRGSHQSAAGTWSGGGALCSADDGASWTVGC